MSIIVYKIEKDKVTVACDGRVIAGDAIVEEDKIKISKVPKHKIICGATGLSNFNDIWREYVMESAEIVKTIHTVKGAMGFAIEFKEYITDNFHCSDEMFDEFGGFFFITPLYHCVIHYDKQRAPYITNMEKDHGCFGATEVYTEALLDAGIGLEDSIKMTAKKFITVNDNIFKLSFDLKHESGD